MTTRRQSTDTVRIAIAARPEIVRAGVAAMVRRDPSLEVVGVAKQARDITATVVRHRPDVAIVDDELVDTAASTAIRQAQEHAPHTRFLLVTSASSPTSTIRRLFEIGASGVISHDAPHEDLLEAIACVHRGVRYLHPSLGARLAQRTDEPAPLGEREREIVRLVALGFTNVEVGRRLFVSTRTVETHRAQVLAKLGLHSRAELVRWALDNRLIGPTTDAEVRTRAEDSREGSRSFVGHSTQTVR